MKVNFKVIGFICKYHQNDPRVDFIMNLLATMGQLFTEMSLVSKNWSNFKVNLDLTIMTLKDFEIALKGVGKAIDIFQSALLNKLRM
jgi:hypothetical protein